MGHCTDSGTFSCLGVRLAPSVSLGHKRSTLLALGDESDADGRVQLLDAMWSRVSQRRIPILSWRSSA